MDNLHLRISDFLTNLTAKGYCCFTYSQVKEALGTSDIAVRAALRRLKEKKVLAQPIKGFYVIIPPEYRILGCRPAEHFIHELMQYVKASYYVGLLSAAQYYGAAHHKPQQYQVVTPQKRRSIVCGQVKIVFITKKSIEHIPTQNINTSQGSVIVSTPEVTLMDLVIYPNRCGGIDNVITVIKELINKIDSKKLLKLTSLIDEITWIQRLGYIFDLINAKDLSEILMQSLKDHRLHIRSLIPKSKKYGIQSQKRSPQKVSENTKWKLIINSKLELDK